MTMLPPRDQTEPLRRGRYKLLLWLFLAALSAVILLWGAGQPPVEPEPEPAEEPEQEEVLPDLVTAEQLEQMSYTDSAMGAVSWTLSQQSLDELNRVLREYDITSSEEISQFLAQAAVETSGGKWLTETGDEAYFQSYGYTTGTRGAGYFHLTFEYGQMAFATWLMRRYIPDLESIAYMNPTCHTKAEIAQAYYSALQSAANRGIDVSLYSRVVYDPQYPGATGADYIAQQFAWESAAYYWESAGIGGAFSSQPGVENTDIASRMVGGGNWQSRREAYAAFYPVLNQ